LTEDTNPSSGRIINKNESSKNVTGSKKRLRVPGARFLEDLVLMDNIY
jgi:hypothetical protein